MEWKPSMNLYELIQRIPEFIMNHLANLNTDNKGKLRPMVGKFYLGLNYDYQQIWMQNQFSKSSGSKDLNTTDTRAKESGVAIYLCS